MEEVMVVKGGVSARKQSQCIGLKQGRGKRDANPYRFPSCHSVEGVSLV
jgi:hypothetical protein